MLDNAGNKIVFWSKVLLYLGIVLSAVAGIVMIVRGAQLPAARYTYYNTGVLYKTGVLGGGSHMIINGFLTIILGSLASWLVALLLRAFGDLSIDTKAIRERLEYAPYEAKPEAPVYTHAEAKPAEPAAPPAEEPAKSDET